jgi:hypothetical protein
MIFEVAAALLFAAAPGGLPTTPCIQSDPAVEDPVG